MAAKSELHVEARKKIASVLAKELKTCRIKNRFPVIGESDRWGWDFSKIVEKHLGKYITDIDACGELIDFVEDAVQEISVDDKEKIVPLSDYLSQDQLSSLSAKILKFIDSIPRTYRIFLRLSRVPSLPWTELNLGEGVMLKHLSKSSPELRLIADHRDRYARIWKEKPEYFEVFYENCVILEMKVIGFATRDPRSAVIASSWENIQEILFAGKSIRLFNTKRASSAFGPPRESLFFLDETNVDSNELIEVELEQGVREKLGKYALTVVNEIPLRAGVIYSEQARRIAAMLNLENVTDTEPVRAAALWGFQAESMGNDTLRFLQTCIGIEAILGLDSDKQGITELLADRCAFLIGGKKSARTFWKDNFKKMYNVRSKVVHGRRRKLKDEELKELSIAESLLQELVKKEINAIAER